MARLEAAITQKANGRLTKENAAFIKALADTMEKRAVSNKDRRARELSLQYASANDYLDANDLYDTLRPGGSSGAAKVVSVGTEEEAMALPVGTKFRLADGRTGTVQ